MTNSSITLSINRALLGSVAPALRGVTFELKNKIITIIFYVDGQISNEYADDLSIVATEVIADFPDFDLDDRVERLDYPRDLKSKMLDGGWVFLRKEP